MGFFRAHLVLLGLLFSGHFLIPSFVSSPGLRAQEVDRIWGRITTVSGDTQEGFIRWDRNEASWADLLDGTKESVPFEFQDWWDLTHPNDRGRDRVIELEGYRITWDDNEPDFPSSVESGIRFGHIRRLIPLDDQLAELELRSGQVVELSGGSTDLGNDIREILVTDARGRTHEVEWEELEVAEFMAAPETARAPAQRLHGTVEMQEGPAFTGYIAWDGNQVLTTDTLNGEDSNGESQAILFGRISEIRPSGGGAGVTLTDGSRMELTGHEDVTGRNGGIQLSDPALGFVDMDWEDLEQVRFHTPESPVSPEGFDGGRRLRGMVVTADSTELSGWIRWDGDEEYSWELLDGQANGVDFDIEFTFIAAIEKYFGESVSVDVGPTGFEVSHPVLEGARVTLRDGRVFDLHGSNDVDDSNHGIFILEDGSGRLPDDGEAEWVLVRWEDFREVHFDWGEGQ